MAILGLTSTESYSSERFTNVRRSVFYFYPNGAAPLTGLLSLLKEEDTDDPEFSWYEKRLPEQRSLTIASGTAAFYTPNGSGSGAASADPFTWTADTSYDIQLVANGVDNFRVGHEIKVTAATLTSGTADLIGIVTLKPGNGRLTVRALHTQATVENGATDQGSKEVLVIGSAFVQGGTDTSSEIYNLPINIGNYTQIFRTPFSMTGTAMHTSAKFDDTGVYKDKAKEHSVYHMIEMEKAFLFGIKRKFVSGGLPTYTTNGVIEQLKLWEAGTTYGNTAATADTDDNKRIIANSTGVMTEKTYDGYLERVFRVTNNTANEKLVLCGSGFLSVINQLYKSKSTLTADLPLDDTYGMNVVKHTTPFGTIFYKSHPLFSQNATMRYNALFLDVHNLVYRYMQGRDTELLKNRQLPDADYRKDEWLTECGLEIRFPESFMYLQNVLNYAP